MSTKSKRLNKKNNPRPVAKSDKNNTPKRTAAKMKRELWSKT